MQWLVIAEISYSVGLRGSYRPTTYAPATLMTQQSDE